MRYDIEFDDSADVIVVKTSGEMTQDDYIEMAESILQHPRHTPGENIIFNHSDLDFSNVTVETLKAIRTFHKQNEDRIGGGKSAIVVKSGFLWKWYELWDQGKKIKTRNKVMVFESLDNAVQWIQ
jgi:hypothetical protein